MICRKVDSRDKPQSQGEKAAKGLGISTESVGIVRDGYPKRTVILRELSKIGVVAIKVIQGGDVLPSKMLYHRNSLVGVVQVWEPRIKRRMEATCISDAN